MRKLGALGVVALLLVAGVSRADDERTVEIELKSGEKVTGRLVNFGERRYKVAIGDQTLSLREEDVRRIEFGVAVVTSAAPEPSAPPAEPAESSPSLAELIPWEKDLPPGLGLRSSQVSGAAEIAGMRDLAKSDLLGRPFLAASEDAVEQALASYTDGGRDAFALAAIRYRSSQAASRADESFRAWAVRGSGHHVVRFLRAGPLRIRISHERAFPGAVDAYVALLRERLARLHPTEDVIEPRELDSLDHDVARLEVPKPWLPRGLVHVSHELYYDVKVAPGIAALGVGAVPGRIVYSAERDAGWITIDVYTDEHRPPETSYAPTGDPTAAELEPFHAVWIGPRAAVTMLVQGEVPKAALDAIEAALVRDLEAFTETRTVKRFAGGDRPPARSAAASAPARAIALVDLIPAPTELPPGFTLTGRKVETGVGSVNGVDYQGGYFTLELCERGDVRVRAYAAVPQTFEAYRADLLRGDSPAEILATSRFVVSVVEDGPVTIEGRDALVALLVKKLEASGAVKRVRLPIERSRFEGRQLVVPNALLPKGVRFIEEGTAVVGTFAGTRAATTDRDYEDASGARIRIVSTVGVNFDRSQTEPLGTPSADALRAFRAAWLTDTRFFAIAAADDVRSRELVAWFSKWIERELARCADTREAKRLEIPKRVVHAASEAMPLADEIPARFEVGFEDRRSRSELENRIANARSSPTKGPLIVPPLEGALDEVEIDLKETGRETVAIVARSYESSDRAAASVTEAIRARAIATPNLREVLQVENLVVLLADGGVSSEGWTAARELVVGKASKLGTVHATPVEPAPELDLKLVLSLPAAATPKRFERATSWTTDDSPVVLDVPDVVKRFERYRSATGEIYLVSAETDRPVEPRRSALRAYRHVWVFKNHQTAIGLRVKGSVPDDLVDVFVRHVESDLRRMTAAAGCEHIDTATLPPLVKPRKGEVYVYRRRDREGHEIGVEWMQILDVSDDGYQVRDTCEGEGSETRSGSFTEPDALRPGETAVTVEASGKKLACARSADGNVRPLGCAFPWTVKLVVADGTVLAELVAIVDGCSTSLDQEVEGLQIKRYYGDTPFDKVYSVAADSRAEKLGFKAGERVILVAKDVLGAKTVVVLAADKDGKKPHHIALDD